MKDRGKVTARIVVRALAVSQARYTDWQAGRAASPTVDDISLAIREALNIEEAPSQKDLDEIWDEMTTGRIGRLEEVLMHLEALGFDITVRMRTIKPMII